MLRTQLSTHRPGCPGFTPLRAPPVGRSSSTLYSFGYVTKAGSCRRRTIVPSRATAVSVVCRASSNPANSPSSRNSKLKRSLWTAVDVVALLGSVGGALAALLGVVSPTYALILPLVLPVVSLIAALQREDLTNEVSPYLLLIGLSLHADSSQTL